MLETVPCPICAKPVPVAEPPDTFPFCCQRCRLRDLGAWCDGTYAIPGALSDEPDEQP